MEEEEMKNGKIVDENGRTEIWYKDDKLHRLDGPAEKYKNGIEAWWKEDRLHRLCGPAITDSNDYNDPTTDCWYIEGTKYLIDDLKEWPLPLYLAYIKCQKNRL
jgi:hypothetical protein